jgi:hypothetical protein
MFDALRRRGGQRVNTTIKTYVEYAEETIKFHGYIRPWRLKGKQ